MRKHSVEMNPLFSHERFIVPHMYERIDIIHKTPKATLNPLDNSGEMMPLQTGFSWLQHSLRDRKEPVRCVLERPVRTVLLH